MTKSKSSIPDCCGGRVSPASHYDGHITFVPVYCTGRHSHSGVKLGGTGCVGATDGDYGGPSCSTLCWTWLLRATCKAVVPTDDIASTDTDTVTVCPHSWRVMWLWVQTWVG